MVHMPNAFKRTLVIGDLHGHWDRLVALLEQEKIVTVDSDKPKKPIRVDYDTEIVLVGDVGHFGADVDPFDDMDTWRIATIIADTILWGNHDRAIVDRRHAFSGMFVGSYHLDSLFAPALYQGKLKFAHEAFGHLITHAGLHDAVVKFETLKPYISDAATCAAWINGEALSEDIELDQNEEFRSRFINNIGFRRGGGSQFGGILWRDIEEKLYDGFPQVFGHSADHKCRKVRYCYKQSSTRSLQQYLKETDAQPSFCVDVGGPNETPGAQTLAGVYLPEGKVVYWNKS